MSEISERIKSRLDRSKGLTQANLTRFCGVSTGAVSQKNNSITTKPPLCGFFVPFLLKKCRHLTLFVRFLI